MTGSKVYKLICCIRTIGEKTPEFMQPWSNWKHIPVYVSYFPFQYSDEAIYVKNTFDHFYFNREIEMIFIRIEIFSDLFNEKWSAIECSILE